MNDPLYNFVDASLYKLTDSQPQQVSPIVNPENIDSGLSTGFSEIVAGGLKQGKHGFDNTETGFILGIDNGVAKFYIGNTTSYISWDGTTLSVVGGVSISSLDIPDTTTANSFHVDSSGNTWWGANVASGLANANASVTKAGAAVFKSIQIGGSNTQYTVSDNGNYTFGDGSDGTATFDGVGAVTGASLVGSTYTLTRDVYYTSATVSTGVTIKPAGYRIFGTGTLTLNGTATIQRNGNAGGAGGTGSGAGAGAGGTAGAALADGYLKGSLAGKVGGAGAGSGQNGFDGTAGVNTSNSIGSNGSAGGNGAYKGAFNGGQGQAGGTATASNVVLRAGWHLQTLLDISSTGATLKYDNSASAGSGGGGASPAGGDPSGGGGGSGSAGGILAVYFRNITVGASASITANGGDGGNGGSVAGPGDGSTGGGGGGGGNGGQVILVYNTLTNNGTITASAGTGGVRGTSNNPITEAVAGTNGTAGTVRQFTVSL